MTERLLADSSTIAIHEESEDGVRPHERYYNYYITGIDGDRTGFAEVVYDTFSSEADREHSITIPDFIAQKIPVGERFVFINTFYPNGTDERAEPRMRAGAGTAVLEEILARAHQENARYMVGGSASPTARRFLEKNGFTLIGDYWFIRKLS